MAGVERDGKYVPVCGISDCRFEFSCSQTLTSLLLTNIPQDQNQELAARAAAGNVVRLKHPDVSDRQPCAPQPCALVSQSKSRGAKARKKGRGTWPVTYKWVAMGTLMAYTAIGGQKIAVVHAQVPSKPTKSQSQTQSAPPKFRFEIPAGLLGDALNTFHVVTGIDVTVADEGIRNVSSPGVAGVYTDEQALQRLLSGTRITYRFIGPNAVTLNLQSVQQEVTVTADGLEAEQVESAKYTIPILDTPQSISVVPEKVMSQQNTTTLRDALRNVAGISLAAGEGSSQGDNLTIRGFTGRNDIFLDGMRDFGSYYRDTFDQQDVQVLEGPSAVTFGRGTTGGVINEVSKTPETTPSITGNATGGSDLTRRMAVDLNEPLSKLGSGAAFRLNLMGDDNKVADRDVAQYRRYGVTPSLAFGLGSPTRVILSYFHQSEDDTPDYGIPWLLNGPAPVARQNYYGFKDANFLRTNDDIATAKIEHDFGQAITLRNVIRYSHEGRNAQITEPQITECVTSNVPGCVTPSTPLDQIQVNRNQINVDSVETSFDDQLDATFRFHTGSIGHSLVTGVEGIRETSDPIRDKITGVPTTSLLNSDESQPYAGISNPSTQVQVTAYTFGIYALDTVNLGDKFDLIGGGRWDHFDADYNQNIAPASAFTQVVGLPSWRGALVYKPAPSGSIYFDVGNSYDPSAESLSLNAATANTPPEESLTFEAGSKWDFRQGKVSAAGSVFRTDMTNAREPDPNNPLLDVLGGHERVNGLQFAVSGHLTDRWEVLSSYALLDSFIVSSQYYPQSVGAQLANVPRNTFNFWSTYRLPFKDLRVGAGVNFVDRRNASSTAPYDPATGLLKQVPGYWVFNAMASYPLNDRATLQVNLNNLTNKYYYDQIHPGHIVPGAGFTALVGINFSF